MQLQTIPTSQVVQNRRKMLWRAIEEHSSILFASNLEGTRKHASQHRITVLTQRTPEIVLQSGQATTDIKKPVYRLVLNICPPTSKVTTPSTGVGDDEEEEEVNEAGSWV